MAVKDQEKTTFITPFGAFCYDSMPFGLKGAQATYQRCVQNCFHSQIGRNVHAYVDDIVVKSRKKETLLDDLRETFDNLWVYKMMLNPAKCVLVYLQASSWVFWSQREVSKLTQRKLRLLLHCLNRVC